MREIETFSWFNLNDAFILFFLVLISSFFQIFITFFVDDAFELTVLLAISFLTLTALIVRKASGAVIFNVVFAFVVAPLHIFGISRLIGVFIFLFAGLLFEVIVKIVNFEIKVVPVGVLIADFVSSASIPLLAYFFSSIHINGFVFKLAEFSISAGFLGIIGGIFAFVLWYELKRNMQVMRYEEKL